MLQLLLALLPLLLQFITEILKKDPKSMTIPELFAIAKSKKFKDWFKQKPITGHS